MVKGFKALTLLTLIATTPLALAANRPTATVDLEHIEHLQRQVQQREFAGTDNAYSLAKARAWLDFALDEYHARDRTGIVQDARDQAAVILGELDKQPDFVASDTPQPYASERVRDDLWQRAAALHQHAGLACARRTLAELEVQLVWTGHEKWESGWDHAAPYARIAENLAYAAEQAAATCIKPTPAVADAPERVVIETRSLATDTLFAFDRHGVEHLVLGGKQKLDALVAELKTWQTLERIELVGHTDRLGSAAYNQALSQRRADAIKRYLVQQGIAAERIDAQGRGETQAIVPCRVQRGTRARVECLQPNRRVEITLSGQR